MKFKILYFFITLGIVLFSSCQKDEVDTSELKLDDDYLFIRDYTDGDQIVDSIHPKTLNAIKSELVKSDRASDTLKLNNTYSKSGKLIVDKPIELKSAVTGFTYHAHVRTYGWLPEVGPGVYSGTKGEKKRVEAIQIFGDEIGILYRVHVLGALTWQGWKSPGQVAGTTGEHKAISKLQIEDLHSVVAPHLGRVFTTEYYIHEQTYGDQGPFVNGEVAGHNQKQIEGFSLRIYYY